MARIAISPERYQTFLDAFMTLGPQHSAVARRIGCDPSTARKAWEIGWPSVPYGVPISRLWEQERQRREALQRQNEAAKEAARNGKPPYSEQASKETARRENLFPEPPPRLPPATLLQESALNALQSEVDLLQTYRGTIIGAVLVANRLIGGLESMSVAVAQTLEIQAKNPLNLTPDKVLRPLEKFARIIDRLVVASDGVMKMQRLLVGAPQQITEQRNPTADSGDLAEKFAKMGEVVRRLREHNLLPGEPHDRVTDAVLLEESNIDNTVSHPPSEPPTDAPESGESWPNAGQNSADMAGNHAEPMQSETMDKIVTTTDAEYSEETEDSDRLANG